MTTLLSLGSIGLMELEIMAFVISVPIPIPFPIPMPRFQCRDLQMAYSCGEHIVSTTTYNKNNFKHFFVHKHHEKYHEKFSRPDTQTHYFINQHSYLNISPINRQKPLLGWPFLDNLILHDEVFKNFISRKNMLCRKWRQKWRCTIR